MSIDFFSLPSGTPLYSYVSRETGANIHIHIGWLRRWLLSVPRCAALLVEVPVDVELSRKYLMTNTVDPKRVVQLMGRHKDLLVNGKLEGMEPLILCQDNISTHANGQPDVFHADGHHRYVMCVAFEQKFVPAYLVPYDLWQPFRVVGHPDLTADQLQAMPVTKRSY